MKLRTTGEVAQRVGIPRWRLIYLLENDKVPAPTFRVPTRRLFTEDDVARIAAKLKALEGEVEVGGMVHAVDGSACGREDF